MTTAVSGYKSILLRRRKILQGNSINFNKGSSSNSKMHSCSVQKVENFQSMMIATRIAMTHTTQRFLKKKQEKKNCKMSKSKIFRFFYHFLHLLSAPNSRTSAASAWASITAFSFQVVTIKFGSIFCWFSLIQNKVWTIRDTEKFFIEKIKSLLRFWEDRNPFRGTLACKVFHLA